MNDRCSTTRRRENKLCRSRPDPRPREILRGLRLRVEVNWHSFLRISAPTEHPEPLERRGSCTSYAYSATDGARKLLTAIGQISATACLDSKPSEGTSGNIARPQAPVSVFLEPRADARRDSITTFTCDMALLEATRGGRPPLRDCPHSNRSLDRCRYVSTPGHSSAWSPPCAPTCGLHSDG